jgi:hypothetical protein
LDFVTTELILNQKVANFEMNFMKELSLGDSISIHENATQNKTIFSVAKEDKNCFAFELNWK